MNKSEIRIDLEIRGEIAGCRRGRRKRKEDGGESV